MHDGLHDIENSQAPVGFLGLPPEIRDQIYEDTLDSAGQRPPKIRTIVAKNPLISQEGTAQGSVYRYHGRNSGPFNLLRGPAWFQPPDLGRDASDDHAQKQYDEGGSAV